MSDRGVRPETDKSAVAIAATAAGTSYEVARYTEAVLYVDVTAVSGTSPTLDVKVQSSPDDSIWADVASGSITQFTAAATRLVAVSNIGRYVRAYYTIGGSATPTVTTTAKWVFKT